MKRVVYVSLVTLGACLAIAAGDRDFATLLAEAAKKYSLPTKAGYDYAAKFSDWSTEPMPHSMNVCGSQPFTNRYCDIIAVVAADGHSRRVLFSPSNAYVDCVRKDLRLGPTAPKPPADNWPANPSH